MRVHSMLVLSLVAACCLGLVAGKRKGKSSKMMCMMKYNMLEAEFQSLQTKVDILSNPVHVHVHGLEEGEGTGVVVSDLKHDDKSGGSSEGDSGSQEDQEENSEAVSGIDSEESDDHSHSHGEASHGDVEDHSHSGGRSGKKYKGKGRGGHGHGKKGGHSRGRGRGHGRGRGGHHHMMGSRGHGMGGMSGHHMGGMMKMHGMGGHSSDGSHGSHGSHESHGSSKGSGGGSEEESGSEENSGSGESGEEEGEGHSGGSGGTHVHIHISLGDQVAKLLGGKKDCGESKTETVDEIDEDMNITLQNLTCPDGETVDKGTCMEVLYPEDQYAYARCDMMRNSAMLTRSNVRGPVYLRQAGPNQPIEVRLDLYGFDVHQIRNKPEDPRHLHGFHVHQFGDFSNGCNSFGGHYNPSGHSHGHRDAHERHAGDWGNIECDSRGVVKMSFNETSSTLFGPESIVGRGIVIHERADDGGHGHTQASVASGNAGGRMACCVISWAKGIW